jgi:hypothetical protein
MIEITARGARTLADVKPLTYAGTGVYVTFSDDTAQLHLGGRIVAQRPASEVTAILDAQDWAYEVIEAADEVQNETAPVDAYETAAGQVRSGAAETLAEAEKQDQLADAVEARPSFADERNPRHPKHKAARIRKWAEHLRADAVILNSWTAQDERGYMAYVSEGLGATDGYFAPEVRTQWKRHQG